MATIAELLARAARDLDEPFRAGEILDWFRAHAPSTKQTSIRAHIQALTGNATNRLENAPVIGARPAVLYRLDHGLYRRWRPTDSPETPVQEPPTRVSLPTVAGPTPNVNDVDALHEWSWEGNVQSAVIGWLARNHWLIRRAADTRGREHGTDIVAERDRRTLHIEVKGWPSTKYVDPARSGEQKRTPPSLQARTWFADAPLQGMRLRNSHPEDDVAIAMPDTATYRGLASSVQFSLARAQVTILLVNEAGEVTGMDHANEVSL